MSVKEEIGTQMHQKDWDKTTSMNSLGVHTKDEQNNQMIFWMGKQQF